MLAQLEAKMQKQKLKSEEDYKNLQQLKDGKLKAKKEKIRTLKSTLQAQQEKILKTDEENRQLTQELNTTAQKLQAAEETCQELAQAKKELQLELQKSNENVTSMSQDIERQQNIIQTQEYKLKETDDQIVLMQKQINEMKEDLTVTIDENVKLKETVARAEASNDYLQNQQNSELAEIEAQLDNLMKENQSLKSESSDAKTTILNLKKQLAQADEMHNNFKEKYLKAKNANKSLKSHLETVENKVRDYVQERTIEIRESELQKEQLKQSESNVKNKLRVLDEIQSMIKKHKQMTQSQYKPQ